MTAGPPPIFSADDMNQLFYLLAMHLERTPDEKIPAQCRAAVEKLRSCSTVVRLGDQCIVELGLYGVDLAVK